jgi:isoaspartyl peptidase/L-asparaginase-like protein (Ntn-hydrolase superfamily)
LKSALCRDAVDVMRRNPPPDALALAIRHLAKLTAGEAGLIAIDARGRFGYAHNARAMEIATYRPDEEVRHRSLPGLGQDD